jgi:predicted ATPase/class 3 adenylate cyclase
VRGTSIDSATRVVLFVDLVGSTTFRVSAGDDAADRLLVRFEGLVADAVLAAEGRVVANHGDGFLMSFGSASNALRAAAAIRCELERIDLDGTEVPAMRGGLSAGDVVERGREMFGLPVVIAARLEGAAAAGEIVCSDLVRSLSGSRSPVEFAHARALQLKGLPEPIDAWTVLTPESFAVTPEVHQPIEWRDDLPVVGNRFFGREHERTSLPGDVRGGTITTLLGPGGVGKTRLSLEVAQDLKVAFPDGVWFVELEACESVDDVVSAVGRALRLPASTGGNTPAELGAALRSLDALVILDNCEQAVDAAAHVARALTADASHVAVLASSREALGLRSERVWPLGPLTPPSDDDEGTNDAVELFLDRASGLDAGASFAPAELANVRAIVRTLEGLPLAIELAASRLSVLSPEQMVARADGLVNVLAQRDRERPDRHHTLAATVDWSVSLLSAEERSVLAAMTVFAGGADLDAITAVLVQPEAEVLDLVEGLVQKSLLRRRADGRFRMLAVIRETVRSRQDMVEEIGAATQLHRDHFAQLARTGANLVQHDPAWLTRFSAEHDNLMAALDNAVHDSPTTALRMAGNLALYWVLSGHANEGDRRFTQVLNAADDADPNVLAGALRGAGMAAALGGRYERSAELFIDARTRYVGLGRPDSVGYCDHWLARNVVVQCHFGLLDMANLDRAYERLEAAIEAFRSVDDGFGILLSYPYLGWIRLLQGDHEKANRLTAELQEMAAQAGVSLVRAYATAHSAFIHLSIGSLETARTEMAAALRGLEQSGDTQNLVITWFVNTSLQLRLDDQPAAIESAIVLCDHTLACDSIEWEPAVLALLAHVLAETGDWEEASILGDALERNHPTWRQVLQNTGIDPASTLEHVVASRGQIDDQANVSMLVRLAKRALLKR